MRKQCKGQASQSQHRPGEKHHTFNPHFLATAWSCARFISPNALRNPAGVIAARSSNLGGIAHPKKIL